MTFGGTTYVGNFDYDQALVPELATKLLIGSGLVGLAGVGRKKRYQMKK